MFALEPVTQASITHVQEGLRRATGLDFRYIGEFTQDKAFQLYVYSEHFARELAAEINHFLHARPLQARVGKPESFDGGEKIAFSFTRWRVLLPLEAVTRDLLEKLEKDGFLAREFAHLLNGLRDRYYDTITAAANAASCQREYEKDFFDRREQFRARQQMQTLPASPRVFMDEDDADEEAVFRERAKKVAAPRRTARRKGLVARGEKSPASAA